MAKPSPTPVPIGATYVMMGQIAECQKHLTDERVDPCNCQPGENLPHPTFIDNIPGKLLGPVSGKPIEIIRPSGAVEVKTYARPPGIITQHSGKAPNVTQAMPVVRESPRRSTGRRSSYHRRRRPEPRPVVKYEPPEQHPATYWGWAVAAVLGIILWSMWSAQSNLQQNIDAARAIQAGRNNR